MVTTTPNKHCNCLTWAMELIIILRSCDIMWSCIHTSRIICLSSFPVESWCMTEEEGGVERAAGMRFGWCGSQMVGETTATTFEFLWGRTNRDIKVRKIRRKWELLQNLAFKHQLIQTETCIHIQPKTERGHLVGEEEKLQARQRGFTLSSGGYHEQPKDRDDALDHSQVPNM